MSEWQNIPDNIEDYQGFVYLIRRKDKAYSYIGKKNFWKIVRYPPLKGKKRIRKLKRETDWKDYWSSNTYLQKDVEKIGGERFERIILMPCENKAMMAYFELYYQMKHRVLFDDDYLNGIINVRLGGKAFENNKELFIKKLDEIEYQN